MKKHASRRQPPFAGLLDIPTNSSLNRRKRGSKGRQPLGGVWGVPTTIFSKYSGGEGRR